jgi:hypothetical protein
MSVTRIFLGLAAVVGAGVVTLLAYYEWVNRHGSRNVAACTSVQRGATPNELVKIFGAPVKEYERSPTELGWIFETPSIRAEPIHAVVNRSRTEVLSLSCGEGPPTWSK